MNHKMMEVFEDCPVIAAVKDEEGLKKCLESEIPVVFVLYGDICNIGDIVGRLKRQERWPLSIWTLLPD